MSRSLEKHRVLLKNSVLLYILNSVVIKFTYTDKAQYAILCKHCNYEYFKEDDAANKSISHTEIFHILINNVRNRIIYTSQKSDISQ